MTIDSDVQLTILVTGGSGLLGHGIQHSLDNSTDERFARRENETWIFANSKDADLRYAMKLICRSETDTLALFERIKPDYVIHLAGRI